MDLIMDQGHGTSADKQTAKTSWAYFGHKCGKVVISDQWPGYAECSICAYRSPLIFALGSNGVLSVKPILYFG